MNDERLVLLRICLMLAVVIESFAVALAGSESDTNAQAEQHIEKANELRKLADYDAAVAEYEKVVSLSPDTDIARNAQYWIGQSYFESKQFDAALSAFQGLLDKYPASSIAPSAKQMMERVQQAKKDRALFEAVQQADIEQVRSLIAEGADLNAMWVDVYNRSEGAPSTLRANWRPERTPLMYAVKAGAIEVVKLLVEAGADVNAGKWPPLCGAVEENNTAIAEYLIDHGARLNYPHDWGPLPIAPYTSDNMEMVKLLIARGADINAAGVYSTLQMSLSRGRRDIFDLLMQLGADVNTRDCEGYNALYFAIHEDDPYYMKTLIANGADVNTKHRGGETPLQSAAITGRTQSVRVLLEAGADVNAKNDKGQTALHVLLDIKNSNYKKYKLSKDTIELLLTKGADVNLKDNTGRTPLHLAAESADAEIVELLLDKGADVNATEDESGFTALHNAARLGKTDVAELLITRGADINAKDKEGHTPLYVAANHDYEVAALLIDKGADSTIETESGQTLLQLAQQRKKAESTVPDMIFDGDPNSLFGRHLVCGDVDRDGYDDILIGAPDYNNNRGRVYLFYGGSDMDTTADLVFEGQNEGDSFGSCIGCGDIDNDGHDDIVVGASYFKEQRGCAYLYWGSDRESMDANPDKVFTGEQEKGSRFGAGYPAVYDIDNDGYDDIILGAPAWGNQTGRAYLYYGNTKELMDTSHDLIFTPDNPEYHFSYAISCGDVDKDGYGDIVIGPYYNRKGARAYLYYGGSKSNMDAQADVVFEVNLEGESYFGQSIVCVDQNRDGYDDVVIGAPGYNNRQGRAYLFRGNTKKTLDVDPDMILDGEVEYSNFGVREICGDLDGDNVTDLIIGANGFRQRGRAYVYWGNELANPDPKPGRIITGETPKDEFGLGLACGDVNNDGFDDLVIAAHRYTAGTNQGRVYLYYGGRRNK